MNKEEEVELQLAIRNHGAYDSAFDSDSSSGKSDFDEEYEAYKPPSISLQDRKYDIVKIGIFETVIHKRPKVKKIHPKLQTNKSTGLSILKKKNKQYYKGNISESIYDNKCKLTNSAEVVKTNKKIKKQSKCSPSFPVNISQSATVTNTKDSVAVSPTITKPICKNDDASVAKSNTIYVSNINNPTKVSNVRQVDSINDNQYETVTKLPINAANLNKQCKNFNLKYKRSLPKGTLSTQNNIVSNSMCSEVPNSQVHLVSSSSSYRPNKSKESTVQKQECNTSVHVPYSSNLTKMPDFPLKSEADTNFCELYDDITSKIELVNIVDIKNCKQQNKLLCVSGPAVRNCTNSSFNNSYRPNQSKECTVQKTECYTSVHVPYSSNLTKMPDFQLKSEADTNFCELYDDILSQVKLVNIVDIRNRKKQTKLPYVSEPALRNCTNSSLNTVLQENTCAYNKQVITLDKDSKISKPKLARELKQKTNKGIISDKCAQTFVYSNSNNGIHDAPLISSNKTSNQLSAALTNNQKLDSMKVCKHKYIEKLSKRVNKKKPCSDMVREQNETPSKSGENYADIKAQNHLSFVDSQGSNKKKSRSGKKSVTEMNHSGTNIEQLVQCNRRIRSFSETQEEPSENRHGNTKFTSASSFLNKDFEVWFMKFFSEPEKLSQPLSSAAVSKNVIDDKLTRKMSKDELFNYWRSGWNIISNFSDYKRSDEQMSHDRGICKTQTTETNSEEKIATVTKTTEENLQNAHCLLHQSTFDDQHIISQKKKPKKKRSRKKKNLDVDATQTHLKGLELLTFSKSNYKTDLKNTAPNYQLADTKINSTVNKETMNSLQITEINDNSMTADVTSPKCTKFSDTNKNTVAVMQWQSSRLNVKRNLYSYTSCNKLSYSLFNMKLKPKVICQDSEVANTVGAQPVLFYFVVMILRRLNNF